MNKLKIGIIMDLLERMIQKGATKFEICAVYSHLGELLFEPNRELWVWGTCAHECLIKYGYSAEKEDKKDDRFEGNDN